MGIFSSEPHPIEKLVKEATAETSTSEDWSKIIAVCDEINSKPSKEGPVAVQALRSRLASPNGNVQLYSLTLLNAIAQNCGPVLQREIASTTTAQVSLKLGTSSSTHRTVIVRLLDVLRSMVEEFASDPTLNQIEQVYKRVCSAHPSSAKANTPDTRSRSNNQSNRQPVPENDDEDEDLKRAIESSIKESQRPTPAAEVARATMSPDTTPKTYVRGLYDFAASEDGELSFKTGDVIEVVDRVYKEWWKGSSNGKEGIFPVNYVESYTPSASVSSVSKQTSPAVSQSAVPAASRETPPSDPLSNPAVMDEEYLFAQVPAVEKLLTILASASQDGNGSNVITNVDVQRLYHQISAMRPRLIQSIDEYTAKKEELVDMNQKLSMARRSYEKLVSDAASGHHRQPSAAHTTGGIQPQPSGQQYQYGAQSQQFAPVQSQYSEQYQPEPVRPQVSGQSQAGLPAAPLSAAPRAPSVQYTASPLSHQPTDQFHQQQTQVPQPQQFQVHPQQPQQFQAHPQQPQQFQARQQQPQFQPQGTSDAAYQSVQLPPQTPQSSDDTPYIHTPQSVQPQQKTYDQPQSFRESQLYQPYQPPTQPPTQTQTQPPTQSQTQPQTYQPPASVALPPSTPVAASQYQPQPQPYQSPPRGLPQKLPYPEDAQHRLSNPYSNGVVTPSEPRPY